MLICVHAKRFAGSMRGVQRASEVCRCPRCKNRRPNGGQTWSLTGVSGVHETAGRGTHLCEYRLAISRARSRKGQEEIF